MCPERLKASAFSSDDDRDEVALWISLRSNCSSTSFAFLTYVAWCLPWCSSMICRRCEARARSSRTAAREACISAWAVPSSRAIAQTSPPGAMRRGGIQADSPLWAKAQPSVERPYSGQRPDGGRRDGGLACRPCLLRTTSAALRLRSHRSRGGRAAVSPRMGGPRLCAESPALAARVVQPRRVSLRHRAHAGRELPRGELLREVVHRHRAPARGEGRRPVTARFRPGDRVRTRAENPEGHTRLPRYLCDRGGDDRGGARRLPAAGRTRPRRPARKVHQRDALHRRVRRPRSVARTSGREPLSVSADLWDSYLEPERAR